MFQPTYWYIDSWNNSIHFELYSWLFIDPWNYNLYNTNTHIKVSKNLKSNLHNVK